MNNHQSLSGIILLVAFVQCLAMIGSHTVRADQLPEWQIFTTMQDRNNKKYVSGHVLYTSSQEKRGAAFQCRNRDLTVFLGAKPTDFKELRLVSYRGTARKVRFSINGGDELSEHWQLAYNGEMYKVAAVSTTRDIFQAASAGVSISITPSYGDQITILLPAVGQDTFKRFLDACHLKTQYLPVPAKEL